MEIISVSFAVLSFLPIQGYSSTLADVRVPGPSVTVINRMQGGEQAPELELRKPIKRELAGGQSHSYRLALAANQYVNVVLEQIGIDLQVKLYGPDGKQLAEFDSEKWTKGDEVIQWVAEAAGSYQLDVIAKSKEAVAGRYELEELEQRAASENDLALHEARKHLVEAEKLRSLGKYDDAFTLAERALAIRERVLGPEHQDVASALNALSSISSTKGDYSNAERLCQRALAIREKAVGMEHPEVASSLRFLGNLYIEMSEYEKAESLHQRALAIHMKTLGPEDLNVAFELTHLAIFSERRGDYEKAELLNRHALAILEKSLGPEHPFLSTTLSNLALVYYSTKNYGQAKQLNQRALAIREKAFGKEHPFVAYSLNNLANTYRDEGNYGVAEPLYQRALAIFEKSLGRNHYFVAKVLHYFATLYRKSGDYPKAEPMFLRSLEIKEKALGAELQDVVETLYELSILYAAKADYAQAFKFLARANKASDRNLFDILAKGSEREKLAVLSLFKKWTDFTLSLHNQTAANDSQARDLAFTTLLRRKGRALEAMTDTIAALRRRATPEDRMLFEQLAEARSQFATLSLKASSAIKIEAYQARLRPLREKIEKFENELNDLRPEYRAQTIPVTISSVQSLLPVGSALVEFALYEPLDLRTEKTKPERYIAYLLTEKGDPKWVDLGEARTIDRMVVAWRNALRDPYRKDVRRLGRELDEKVMRPVRYLLGETRHLLIAPDSKLNLIPFAALVDEENRYLVERFSISYLTSGRDLLRLQTSHPSRSAPLIVANPVFGRPATILQANLDSPASQSPKQAPVRIDQTQIFFQQLPGTEDEALAIKAVLPEASLLLREQSTEAAVKEVSGPRILHVATHGFFLKDQESRGTEMRALPDDNPQQIAAKTSTAPGSAQIIRFTVQLYATPELEIAQEKLKGFKSQKVDAYIVRAKKDVLGAIYRVRVGKFSKYTEAQMYLAELLRLGFGSDFFIASYTRPPGDLPQPEPPLVGAPGILANSTSGTSSSENRQPGKGAPLDLRLSKFAARVEDPLLRSGLALAGANQGKSGANDDGLLTAMEASGLDLLGTKLVVLSACDTGVGDLRTGEGVQGLRRALVLAGSESQVISLWPVPDQSTRDLMVPYYYALRQGEGRSEGLRQVQLRMLRNKEYRHPFYWAAFIQSGDWANLEGENNP